MKLTTSLAALLLCLNLFGCKNDADKQMSDVTEKQKEMVNVLRSVKDKDSAKAANEKLKAIAKDMADILEQSKKTSVSQAEQKRIVDKYKPEQEQAQKDMQAEMLRVMQIPGAMQEMAEGFRQIGSVAPRGNR
jgi:hypothetical protein